MCVNFAFVPIIWYTFVETKGYPLEKLDEIFEEAYEKEENPVWTERRIRKNATLHNDGKQAEEAVSSGTDIGDEKRMGRDSRNKHMFGAGAPHRGHGGNGRMSGSDTAIEEREKMEGEIDRTDRFPYASD